MWTTQLRAHGQQQGLPLTKAKSCGWTAIPFNTTWATLGSLPFPIPRVPEHDVGGDIGGSVKLTNQNLMPTLRIQGILIVQCPWSWTVNRQVFERRWLWPLWRYTRHLPGWVKPNKTCHYRWNMVETETRQAYLRSATAPMRSVQGVYSVQTDNLRVMFTFLACKTVS